MVESIKDSVPKVEWDFEGIHYSDGGPLTVQYLLVLDALNFCFWPGNFHLASTKILVQNDIFVNQKTAIPNHEILNWLGYHC